MSRLLIAFVLSAALSHSASLVSDLRYKISAGDLPGARAVLEDAKRTGGISEEYILGVSWMARGSLIMKDFASAVRYADETQSLIRAGSEPSNANASLNLAYSAAVEVKAQALAQQGKSPAAIAYVKEEIVRAKDIKIQSRLHKNLNQLTLTGQPAFPIHAEDTIGPPFASLAALSGKPVLMFFWAHWCGDCKAEGPVIARLKDKYAPKGLVTVTPTRLYGYGEDDKELAPDKELPYIAGVKKALYPGLLDTPSPLSTPAFIEYGVSTTPTIVLLDRQGKVRLYHAGRLSEEDLDRSISDLLSK